MYMKGYKHIKCNCGGIIGLYNRKNELYTCERCGAEYVLTKLDYDVCMVNSETGWIFPMKKKEDGGEE